MSTEALEKYLSDGTLGFILYGAKEYSKAELLWKRKNLRTLYQTKPKNHQIHKSRSQPRLRSLERYQESTHTKGRQTPDMKLSETWLWHKPIKAGRYHYDESW
jgi:hypothetical protein